MVWSHEGPGSHQTSLRKSLDIVIRVHPIQIDSFIADNRCDDQRFLAVFVLVNSVGHNCLLNALNHTSQQFHADDFCAADCRIDWQQWFIARYFMADPYWVI